MNILLTQSTEQLINSMQGGTAPPRSLHSQTAHDVSLIIHPTHSQETSQYDNNAKLIDTTTSTASTSIIQEYSIDSASHRDNSSFESNTAATSSRQPSQESISPRKRKI